MSASQSSCAPGWVPPHAPSSPQASRINICLHVCLSAPHALQAGSLLTVLPHLRQVVINICPHVCLSAPHAIQAGPLLTVLPHLRLVVINICPHVCLTVPHALP
jgi:hypothetical protein